MTIPFTSSAALTEDEIDDALYLARTGESADFQQFLDELSQKYGALQANVVKSAVDAESGNSALHFASANGHTDIINTLQSHFTSDDAAFATFINAPNRAGNTSLHWAALNGHLAVVQSLVKCGGDPSKTNNAGHDVVFEAEQNDKEAVVKWLLKEVPGLERAIGGSGNEAEGEVEGEVIGNGEEVEEENVDGISGAVVDGDVDMG